MPLILYCPYIPYLHSLKRNILYDAYRLGLRQATSKCSLRAGNLRLGIFDGTSFGRFEASSIKVVGAVSLMVDLQQIPKRDEELLYLLSFT